MSLELIGEYNELVDTEKPKDYILKLALELVPFCLKHNAEADACDLLLELEQVSRLTEFVDKDNYERVCLYILR